MAAGSNELAVILTNLTGAIGGAIEPIRAIGYLLGLCFLGFGLMNLRRVHDGPQGGGGGKATASIVIGVLMLSLTGTIDTLSVLLFGHETQMLSAAANTGSDVLGAYMRFAITLVVVVGFYCVIKGLIKLRHTGDGREDQWWSGWTHIVGGIVCCNISSFAHALGSAAGGVVQDVVNKLF